MNRTSHNAARRRRLLARFAPLAVLAAISFGVGAIVASGSADADAAERFARAWQERDFEAMYAELSPAARGEFTLEEFEREYARAERTATVDRIEVGETREAVSQDGEDVVPVAVRIETDSFGTVAGELGIPVLDGAVDWRPSVVFPGLRPGETLDRQTRAPERAPILARDRTPIASGPADARLIEGTGGVVVGELGEPSPKRAKQMARQGFPEGTPAGASGLELAFDERLAGTPGGRLFARSEAGRRELAQGDPTPGKPLRTTLDPALQDAAVAALGEQFGGVAVLDARNGDIRALSGIAFSAPQPPGSTFKIITTVGALEEGIAEPSSTYPAVTSTPVGGREIDNSNEEACGGDLVTSFARSCNTVFAPLGAELGEEQLLDFSERFGFNAPPTLYNESALGATQPPSSTVPDPIGSELDVAVSAIGQGKVLATPLQMASVAQTVANRGVRSPTSLVTEDELRSETGDVEVTSTGVAREVGKMMEQVVRSGTGQAAAIPGVEVAGKTGTAELGPKAEQPSGDPDAEPELEVNAWFAAYAPAKRPRLAVAVMIVNADGDGGVVAAPIAREILAGAL